MSATCSVPAPVPYSPYRPAKLTGRSGAMALSLRVLAAGGLFLSHIVLMRGLGVTGFGEYSLAIAWLQILTGVAKLGLDNTSLRYVSEYVTNSEFGKLRRFIRDSTFGGLIGSVAVMIGVMVAAILTWSMIGDRLATCLIVGSVMIPPITIRQIQEARLRGVGRLFESQVGTALWPAILFVLAAVFWLTVPSGFSSLSAVSLHLIALCAVFVLVVHFQRQIRFHEGAVQPGDACRRQWAGTALAFLTAEILISLKGRVCITLAGMMLDCQSAGLFGAMEKFADASLLASQSLGLVLAPQFASLYAAGRYTEMRRLLRRGQILGLIFTLPIAVGIAVFGDTLFTLLGSSYRAGWNVLLTLLVASSVLSYSAPMAIVLQMTGRERTMLWITAACAVTNIVFSILLMRSHGVLGLGIAQVATSLVWTLGVQARVWRHPAWEGTAFENPVTPGETESKESK